MTKTHTTDAIPSIRLWADTVEPKRCAYERKLDVHHELYIIGLVLQFPLMQLSELVRKVTEISGTVVSISTMCRLLVRHGLTHKKIQHVALQICVSLRASSMANMFTFSKEMFVFVDETGSKVKEMLRKYGYSICGERAVSHQLQLHEQNVTSIAAISTEGLVALEIHCTTVDGDTFLDFVRGALVPKLHCTLF